MTGDADLRRLLELAENARRAQRASERLNRLARQNIAQLYDLLADLTSDAQGGTAHEHRQPRVHVHA